jgi:predicted nuclease of predicted toxin-antitoxin system
VTDDTNFVGYLLDENIPYNTIKDLRDKGLTIKSVYEIMPGSEDNTILEFAFQEKLVLITMDKDFGELIFKLKLSSFGVILCRIVPETQEHLTTILHQYLTQTNVNPSNKFVIIRENRIREVPLNK